MKITNYFSVQFFKFILNGALNTFVGFGLFILFNYLNFSLSSALFFTYIFGVLFNFYSIGYFVFNKKSFVLNKFYFNAIFRFISIYVIIFLLNFFILRYCIFHGLDKIFMQGCLLFFFSPLAYLGIKFFVYRKLK